MDVDKIFDIAICSIIAAVVGARLFFILFYDLSYYLENPMEIILWRKRKTIEYDGQLFIWYVILFSVNRGAVELFRINPYIIGGFSVSHLLSLLFIIGAVALMSLAKKRSAGIFPDSIDSMERHTGNGTDLVKDSFIIIFLVAVSLVIFYAVQS